MMGLTAPDQARELRALNGPLDSSQIPYLSWELEILP